MSKTNFLISISLLFLFTVSQSHAKDIFFSNYTEIVNKEKTNYNAASGSSTIVFPNGYSVQTSPPFVGLIVDVNGTAIPSELVSQIQLPESFTINSEKYILRNEELLSIADAIALNNASANLYSASSDTCSFTKKFFEFCGNLKYGSEIDGFISDIEAFPLLGDGKSIKLSILRYNLHLGDDLAIPISLLVSDVASTTGAAESNNIKIIDPDQGVANFKLTYAGRYHFGDFCRFSNNNFYVGNCVVGINLGLKYLELQTEEEEVKNVFGSYIGVSNTFMFPITDKADGKDAGQLMFNVAANYYTANMDGSELFPNILDGAGKKIDFQERFFGYALTLDFQISDRISLKASFFDAPNNESLDSHSEISFKYSFLK